MAERDGWLPCHKGADHRDDEQMDWSSAPLAIGPDSVLHSPRTHLNLPLAQHSKHG